MATVPRSSGLCRACSCLLVVLHWSFLCATFRSPVRSYVDVILVQVSPELTHIQLKVSSCSYCRHDKSLLNGACAVRADGTCHHDEHSPAAMYSEHGLTVPLLEATGKHLLCEYALRHCLKRSAPDKGGPAHCRVSHHRHTSKRAPGLQ
jgi:hypothetical protein